MMKRLIPGLILLLAACSPEAEAEEVTSGSEPETVNAYLQELEDPGIYLFHEEESGYFITIDRPAPVELKTEMEEDLLLLQLEPADEGKTSAVYRISMNGVNAIELTENGESMFFTEISGF
ncbi:hypothetical protein [Alkalicoccus luteus]|uniref:Uncharacterized protein n=1 Tax=Alkalicoccus luteus TaxID=1237094 RepID=A0A969TWT4_9BACI|nr:hypothetical protein [Alkalicoccus luteus]NJP37584.1 hypothetical protein [Alkalicoccus luteus]